LPFAHHERTQILPFQLHARELAPVVVLAAHAHLHAPVQGQPRERLAGRLAVGLADLRSIDAVEPQLARRPAGVGRGCPHPRHARLFRHTPGPLKFQVQHPISELGSMKEDRKYEHLSYEERSTIALGLQQGMSVRALPERLDAALDHQS
jgi:hypothetical protein